MDPRYTQMCTHVYKHIHTHTEKRKEGRKERRREGEREGRKERRKEDRRWRHRDWKCKDVHLVSALKQHGIFLGYRSQQGGTHMRILLQ